MSRSGEPHLSPFIIAMPWAVWVYVLSLVCCLLPQAEEREPSERSVLTVSNLTAHVPENAPNGLVNSVAFELSKPLDFRLEVPVTVTDGSARLGEHYAMRRRPRVIFEAGSKQGVLSGDGDGCDVIITDDHELLDGEPRSFDITLGTVEGIVELDASRSTCRVSIDDDEMPPASRVKIRFASSGGELTESQVAGHSLSVQAEKTPEEKSEMTVVVQRQGVEGNWTQDFFPRTGADRTHVPRVRRRAARTAEGPRAYR